MGTNPDKISFACGNTRGPSGRRVFCKEAQKTLDFINHCCPRHHIRRPGWSVDPNALGQRVTVEHPASAGSQAGPRAGPVARPPPIEMAGPQSVLQPTPSKIPPAVPQAKMEGVPLTSLNAILQAAPSVQPHAGLPDRKLDRKLDRKPDRATHIRARRDASRGAAIMAITTKWCNACADIFPVAVAEFSRLPFKFIDDVADRSLPFAEHENPALILGLLRTLQLITFYVFVTFGTEAYSRLHVLCVSNIRTM